MPTNMFFIVKNHWEHYFTDNPRKKHKPWFDEGCSKLLDQRKQAKLQWLQDPSKINGDTLFSGFASCCA
jgi:hypothetical protein